MRTTTAQKAAQRDAQKVTNNNSTTTAEKEHENMKHVDIMERLTAAQKAAAQMDADTLKAAIRAARAFLESTTADAAEKDAAAAVLDALKETLHQKAAAQRDAAQRDAAAARVARFNSSRNGQRKQKAAAQKAAAQKAAQRDAQKAARVAQRDAQKSTAAIMESTPRAWKKAVGILDVETLTAYNQKAARVAAEHAAQKAARVAQIQTRENSTAEKMHTWKEWDAAPERQRHELKTMIQHVIRVYAALGWKAGELYSVIDISPVLFIDENGHAAYINGERLDDVIAAAWLNMDTERKTDASHDMAFRLHLYSAACHAVENVFNEYRRHTAETIATTDTADETAETAFLPVSRYSTEHAVILDEFIQTAGGGIDADAALVSLILDGYTMKDAAAALGISRKTLYVKRLPRIRERLSEYGHAAHVDEIAALFTSAAAVCIRYTAD